MHTMEKENQTIRSDSPLCLQECVYLFFSLAVSNGLNVGSIDIKCAFLQWYKIDRDIYIKPPRRLIEINCRSGKR